MWSLGCTIIEMATGQLPWTAKHDSGATSGYPLMLHIANSDDIPYIPTWLPDECIELIKSCLQRPPSKRSTAQELINCRFFQLENFSMLPNNYSLFINNHKYKYHMFAIRFA